MSDRFDIDLQGEAELKRLLGAAVLGLRRPHELMDRIGALMERNIQFRFDTKTAPDGSRWLPLAESTRKSYAAKYKGAIPGGLLERTRHMRDSLSHNAYDSFVEVGFGDAVAQYHETGTQRMPRRQLLTDDPIAGTLGAQDRQDILDEVADYLRSLNLL